MIHRFKALIDQKENYQFEKNSDQSVKSNKLINER